MKEQTGLTYEASPSAKSLFVAGAKDGKTTLLLAQALGIWPGQNGGIVDKPSHLHVIAADASAVKGFMSFALNHLKAPKEAMGFRVYNVEDDVRRAFASPQDWDFALYNSLLDTIRTIQQRAQQEKGVHVLHVSSLTGVAAAIKRAIQGPTALKGKKGSGMDMAKWDAFGSQIAELRNNVQLDDCHAFWEGHLDQRTEGKGDDEVTKDTIGVQGTVGKNFAMNVAEVFRIRRNVGMKVPGTIIDQMYFDTQPSLSFMNSGRGFSELPAKVTDLTAAFVKLGYKVGRWGAKAKAPAVPVKQTQPIEEEDEE